MPEEPRSRARSALDRIDAWLFRPTLAAVLPFGAVAGGIVGLVVSAIVAPAMTLAMGGFGIPPW